MAKLLHRFRSDALCPKCNHVHILGFRRIGTLGNKKYPDLNKREQSEALCGSLTCATAKHVRR